MQKILLLVDDEPSILRSLKRVFRGTDYHILTASDGFQALALIRENPISVLLSDYKMPDMSGAELLSEANKIRPDMSRLILSGNNDQESVIKSINDGAALKFLTKPWDQETLLKEIEAAFDVWSQNRFSLNVPGLLNKPSFINSVDATLAAVPQRTHAVVNIQIREFHKIRQILDSWSEQEFIHEFYISQKIIRDENIVFALLDDDRLCAHVDTESRDDIEPLISAIIRKLSDTFAFDGQEFRMRYDTGYALFTGTENAEDLIGNAYTALNMTVTTGSTETTAYDPEMYDATKRRFTVEKNLQYALQENEFLLYYQPKIKTQSQSLHGAEALIRWNNSELGLVSPLDFIPLAESSDMINDIGYWVMQEASEQWRKWFQNKYEELRISVNVSPRQLRNPRFVEHVAAVLNATGLAPLSLELEITESIVMQDVERTQTVLNELKTLGIKLSIDDFGTGYSSLNYLDKLPLDVLKIDRSFIVHLAEREKTRNLVKNLILMARDLGMELVAEGVETDSQIDILGELGCDVIQGYYYSPPVNPDEFSALMVNYPVLSPLSAQKKTDQLYKKAG
ncbi:MAG: EAL domain-containing protein [Granulosicoccus sp.]|nr:EAL domain-containing protein [Granulosicoccus sp.]